MDILVGCEYSGTVRNAFLWRGHNAWSNDIIETDNLPDRHMQCDIIDALRSRRWGGAIIHIPCTAMCVAGNRHYAGTKERADAIWWSLEVWAVAKEQCDWVAMENPQSVLFPFLRNQGADVQYIQPWQFGHPENKKTGLALHKVQRLRETHNVYEEMMLLPINVRDRVHHMPPSEDRSKERARFFPGIANAMAEQWGGWL